MGVGVKYNISSLFLDFPINSGTYRMQHHL
jgi:hypothetical protein